MVGTYDWHNQFAAALLAPALVGFALAARRPAALARGRLGGGPARGGRRRAVHAAGPRVALLAVGWVVVLVLALLAAGDRPARGAVVSRALVCSVAAVGLTFLLPGPPLFSSSVSPFAGASARAGAGETLDQNGVVPDRVLAGVADRVRHQPGGRGRLRPRRRGGLRAGSRRLGGLAAGALRAAAGAGRGRPAAGACPCRCCWPPCSSPCCAGCAGRPVTRHGRRTPCSSAPRWWRASCSACTRCIDTDWSYPALAAQAAVVAGVALRARRRTIRRRSAARRGRGGGARRRPGRRRRRRVGAAVPHLRPASHLAHDVRRGTLVKQLGDILLEGGLVTQAQLQAAYDEHQRAGRSLGRVLVDQGVLTEAQLVAALAQQIGLRFVDLADFPVDHSAVGLVSGASARRYVVLPIGYEDGKLLRGDGRPGERLRHRRHPRRHADGGQARASRPAPTCSPRSTGTTARTATSTTSPRSSTSRRRRTSPRSSEVVEDAPIVKFVNLLITQAIQDRASDIHLEPTERDLRVRYRIDGVLHEIMRSPEDDPVRRHQPPEDHGGHQHRRAAHPAGRPALGQRQRQEDRPARRDPADGVGREGRHAHPGQLDGACWT